jgi:hypothetical protein
MLNGLSDHHAQMLDFYVVNLNSNRNDYKTITIRKIYFNTISEVKNKLSNEFSQNVFENDNNDINRILNFFLNTYLQVFFLVFPKY